MRKIPSKKILEKAVNFVEDNATANNLMTAGLTGATGASIYYRANPAEQEDMIDSAKTIGKIGAVLGATAIGGKMSRDAFRKVRNYTGTKGKSKTIRETGVGLLDNYLDNDIFSNSLFGFYKGGIVGKIGSVAQEATRGAGRAFDRFTSFSHFKAARATGINSRQSRMVRQYEDYLKTKHAEYNGLVSNLNNRKVSRKDFKKQANLIKKDVKKAEKVIHNKFINDYSNSYMYNDIVEQSTPLAKYASPFVKPKSYETLVNQARKPEGIGEDALNNLIEIQGSSRAKEALKYLELSGKGVRSGGDVLQSIQMNSKAYNFFQKIQKPQKLSMNEINNSAKDVFDNVIKLDDNRLQIIFSPKGKPNIDWGGYAGTMVWDKRDPTKMKMMADDLRDLFGMNFGHDVLNISPVKKITIPEILEKTPRTIKDTGTRSKKVDWKKEKIPFEVEEQIKLSARSEEDRANMVRAMRDYATSYLYDKSTLMDKAEFAVTRGVPLAIGGTGVYVLGLDE